MKKTFKMGSLYITAVLLMLSLGNASAAPVNFQIIGDVVLGDEFGDVNAFGLTAGDIITATGTFNDNVLTSGSGTIDFSSSSSNSMTINVGTETFTAANDTSFGTGGGPSLTLSSLVLTDFDFLAFAGTNGAAADFSSNFTSFDDLAFMFGDWRTDIAISAVPVPAAVWLFGSGLIGLVGIARRKRV